MPAELAALGRYNATVPAEIEAKYEAASLDEVEAKLSSLGAEPAGEVTETDTFFDTPAGDLSRGDRGLRLRSSRADRGEPRGSLTYKGPRQHSGGSKQREEIESTVGDIDAMGELLRACGLISKVTIQKRRRRWRLHDCEVSLDELPLLGTFVEIEGPSPEAIEAVSRELELVGEPIVTPYFMLLNERCPRVLDGCGRATFEACDECEHGRSA